MRKLHFAWIAIAAGMLARAAWAALGPDAVFADALGYRAIAHALAEGRGASAYWMPGWPFWMSLVYRVGGGDGAVIAASVALGAATIGATWLLARELFDRQSALVAAAACALVPSLVLLPRLLLSENLAIPLFALATVALVRAVKTRRTRDWIAFALATAAATYVRESSAVLVLAAILSRSPRAIAIALVTFALALAPWALRNRAATGHVTLTTSSGPNLCIGLGDGATGGYRKLDDAITQEEGLRCAREGLAHRPLEIVTLAPAKLSRLVVWDDWIVDDFLDDTSARGGATRAMRAFCNLGWWALLAGAAVVSLRRRETRVLLVPMATVALSVVVTFGVGRFHAPLIPLLAVLASGYRRRS